MLASPHGRSGSQPAWTLAWRAMEEERSHSPLEIVHGAWVDTRGNITVHIILDITRDWNVSSWVWTKVNIDIIYIYIFLLTFFKYEVNTLGKAKQGNVNMGNMFHTTHTHTQYTTCPPWKPLPHSLLTISGQKTLHSALLRVSQAWRFIHTGAAHYFSFTPIQENWGVIHSITLNQ